MQGQLCHDGSNAAIAALRRPTTKARICQDGSITAIIAQQLKIQREPSVMVAGDLLS